jgi:viroplasmin and RNaseH domain-containing protein
MGDFDINLLKSDIHNPTNDFINSTPSQGFVPVITKPTRLTHSSATIIDHIYTNCITTKSKSGIILNDVADHFEIFYMMNQCKSQQTRNINKIRYYTEQNTEQFINLIEKQDFTKVHNLYDTDLAYNEFLSIINSAHDKAFPIQIAKEKKTRH